MSGTCPDMSQNVPLLTSFSIFSFSDRLRIIRIGESPIFVVVDNEITAVNAANSPPLFRL